MKTSWDFVFLVPLHQDWIEEGWDAFRILDEVFCRKARVRHADIELVAMAEPDGDVHRFFLGGSVTMVDRRTHRYAVATPTQGHRG